MGSLIYDLTAPLRRVRAYLNGTSHLLSSEAYVDWLRRHGVKVGAGTVARAPREIFVDIQRPELITIGRNVLLHRGTRILAHDYASRVFVNLDDEYLPSQGRVRIGDNVWLGEGVTILKGADIGDNVIIGAGAVVTGRIPSGTVAVGAPARVICTLDEYRRRRAAEYVEEAIDYAMAIYESGRTPRPEDFERDYPVFVDARNWQDHPFKYPEFSARQLKLWLLRHRAPYAGFGEFMAEVARRRDKNLSKEKDSEFISTLPPSDPVPIDHTPIVSVIVTAFDEAAVLSETLRSLLGQTLTDIEVIVVDDGSEDDTLQVARNIAGKDSRVRIISHSNRGLGLSRNAGLEVAGGEYVAFADAGDTVDATMYARLLSVAREYDADIVSCGHMREESQGVWREVRDFETVVSFEGEVVSALMPHYVTGLTDKPFTMSVWHAIYRRQRITVRFLSERDIVSEDLPYQLNALRMARRVVYIPDILYRYCYSPVSLSHTFSPDKVDRYGRLADWLCEFFGGESEGRTISDIFYCTVLRNLRREAALSKRISTGTLLDITYRILHDPKRVKATPAYLRHIRKHGVRGALWTALTDRLMSALPGSAAALVAKGEARLIKLRDNRK